MKVITSIDDAAASVGEELGVSEWHEIDQDRINAFADPVQARKDFVARQPMGRLGTVDDIMGILVFLASDESLFATGNAYSIDGGMTI